VQVTRILTRLARDVAANALEGVRARLERALLGKTVADWNERVRCEVECRRRVTQYQRAHERRLS
jgi:hypothetical protein